MLHLFDVTYLISTYGYAGIFLIVFFESGIFFPLPGDSLIFTAGLLAPLFGFNVMFLTFLIFFAAFVGGLAGYYIGHKIEYLHRFTFFRKILKKEYIDKAHAFFEKHGLSSLLLSRFIPVVRTFLPIVAGIAHMKYSSFVRYSLLGSFVWSAAFVLGAYFLGRAFPKLENYLLLVVTTIVFLSILPGFYHWWKHRK